MPKPQEKPIKICHLMEDEKFCDNAHKIFSAVPRLQQEYMVLSASRSLKHIKTFQPRRISRLSFLNPLFIRTLQSFDLLVVHGLSTFVKEVIGKMRFPPAIAWIGFGYDYLELAYGTKDIIAHQTKQIEQDIGPKTDIRNVLKKFFISKPSWEELLPKITTFSPVLHEEYELIVQNWKSLLPEEVEWNFTHVFDQLEQYKPRDSNKNSTCLRILVGNSATATNNHIELLNKIRETIPTSDYHLIIPANYGDLYYRESLEKECSKIFPEKYTLIKDFMPIEEYLDTVNSCSMVALNHLRQQAGGAIAAGLLLGKRVILNPESPFYSHYRSLGGFVNTTDDLDKPETYLSPLPYAKREKNRTIIWEKQNHKRSVALTENLIRTTLALHRQRKSG